MNTGDRIKQLRLQLDLTQEELAALTNTTKQTIHKYETGIIENIPPIKIQLLAKKLQTTPAYLMGWDQANNPSHSLTLFSNASYLNTKKVPMLKGVKGNIPIFSDDDRESYIQVIADIKADFCMRCKDAGMLNARILEGDIIFIKEQSFIDNGAIAAVIADNEVILRRITDIKEKNTLILKAENPKYADKVYIGDELDQIKIIGKAVAFIGNIL